MSDAAASRRIGFAGACIAVHAYGARAVALVDWLFRDVATPADESPATATFEVRATEDGRLTVTGSDLELYAGPSEGSAALALQDASSFALASDVRGGLLLHAAAVSLGPYAVAFPGKTGAGKTTLAAHLTRRGCTYLTDEFVFLADGDTVVQGYPRPFNIKATGLAAVDTSGWETCPGASATLALPPRARASYAPPHLAAIVFPRFQLDGGTELTPLSAAERGLRLMGMLLNARNLDGHGFAVVTALARRTDGYALAYDSVGEAADLVMQLVERRARDER